MLSKFLLDKFLINFIEIDKLCKFENDLCMIISKLVYVLFFANKLCWQDWHTIYKKDYNDNNLYKAIKIKKNKNNYNQNDLSTNAIIMMIR